MSLEQFFEIPFLGDIANVFVKAYEGAERIFSSIFDSFQYLLTLPTPLKDFWVFIPRPIQLLAIGFIVYGILIALFRNFFK